MSASETDAKGLYQRLLTSTENSMTSKSFAPDFISSVRQTYHKEDI